MTGHTLAANVRTFLGELVGEQFDEFTDSDGDVHFRTALQGTPVGLIVEPWGKDESLLVGFHIVGVALEDHEAAAKFVAEENNRIRVGRMEMAENGVVFTHQVFGSSVGKDTVRSLLSLVATASCRYGDLAERTGALTLVDFAALDAPHE